MLMLRDLVTLSHRSIIEARIVPSPSYRFVVRYPEMPPQIVGHSPIPTSLALMTAHTIEVFVWSVAYAIMNAAPDDANLVYFAWRALGKAELARDR
jgi:hypothetical protein